MIALWLRIVHPPCDEVRLLHTRFGTIPCPNCNPAAEEAS